MIDITNLTGDLSSEICNEIIIHQKNLDWFLLLIKQQNFWKNSSLIVDVALCLFDYV